jgi:hypothetical protein
MIRDKQQARGLNGDMWPVTCWHCSWSSGMCQPHAVHAHESQPAQATGSRCSMRSVSMCGVLPLPGTLHANHDRYVWMPWITQAVSERVKELQAMLEDEVIAMDARVETRLKEVRGALGIIQARHTSTALTTCALCLRCMQGQGIPAQSVGDAIYAWHECSCASKPGSVLRCWFP